jgi:hypothetical protein
VGGEPFTPSMGTCMSEDLGKTLFFDKLKNMKLKI